MSTFRQTVTTSAPARGPKVPTQAQSRRWGRAAAQAAATAASAKAKARSRKQRKTKQGVQQKVGMSLSPLVRSIVPSIEKQGQAFPLFGRVVIPITIPTTKRTIVFVSNVGTSGTVAAYYQWGGTVDTPVAKTVPLLTADDTAGGPTSMRAMKVGMTITNRSQILNRGAQCYFFNCQQRLRLPVAPGAMTNSQWDAVFTALSTMPGCRDHDLAEYGVPRHYYSNVVDSPRYNDFSENHGSLSVSSFLQHIAVWPGGAVDDRPMSTLCFLVEPAATENMITITVDAAWYTRWPLDTVAGQAQIDVPTTSPSALNGLHQKANDHASSGSGISLDGMVNLGANMLSAYIEHRRGRRLRNDL